MKSVQEIKLLVEQMTQDDVRRLYLNIYAQMQDAKDFRLGPREALLSLSRARDGSPAEIALALADLQRFDYWPVE